MNKDNSENNYKEVSNYIFRVSCRPNNVAVHCIKNDNFNNNPLATSCLNHLLHLREERDRFNYERRRWCRVQTAALKRKNPLGWSTYLAWTWLILEREIFCRKADFAVCQFLISHLFCSVPLNPVYHYDPYLFKLLFHSKRPLPVLHYMLSSWRVFRKVPYLPALLYLLKSGPLCASRGNLDFCCGRDSTSHVFHFCYMVSFRAACFYRTNFLCNRWICGWINVC